MPVETAYKIMKNWLRINGKMLNDMGLPMGVAFGELLGSPSRSC